MRQVLLSLFLSICAGIWALSVQAQESPRAILVLDASGSMWGQIDGTAKITIAQDVIGGLLESLPPQQELGLTAYGHRRKGDCSDIETMIVPGGDQRANIANAVNGIKPKGKTPLSAAVIQAAEALKYTEEAATVILVSDGKETCDFDPCEVGRQLEDLGIDFTAHVIGFDVTAPEDRAQLQCLAEETGGTFRTASSADELADALKVVAEAPAPEPDPITVRLRALDGPDGAEITNGVTWTLTDNDANPIEVRAAFATPGVELMAGTYRASVTRDADSAMGDATFQVDAEDMTVTIVLPNLPPPMRTLVYRAQNGEKGQIIADPLVWDIYAEDGTAVMESNQVAKGSIELPAGSYRIEVLRPVDEATAEANFRLTSGDRVEKLILPEFKFAATVDAPISVVAGSKFQASWTGPALKDDYIAVTEIDARAGRQGEYTYVKDGSPLTMQAPSKPGEYEVRYIQNKGREILASRKITVTPVAATVSAPADLIAGSTVRVDWTGPDYKNDFVAVVQPGEDRKWINYSYTHDGAPAKLQMPPEAGQYELLYVMNQDREVIARTPITVSAFTASVTPPVDAVAGSTVPVPWAGPDYKNDFIAVVEPGEDRKWINYTYTNEGSPAKLQMPTEAGEYEILYVLDQDREVIVRVPVSVSGITTSVTPPADLLAGATVPVTWTGPDYKNDFIAVVPRGEDGKWINYTYTSDGSPAKLEMPPTGGDYDVGYVLDQDRVGTARVPITVAEVTADVIAPADLTAGDTVPVDWSGPDYKNDFIAVVDANKPNKWINYTYTRDGSPAKLKLPVAPGDYEIVYVMDQDRTVMTRLPISTTGFDVVLTPPAELPVGEKVAVDWSGPDYKNDFVAIVERGADRKWIKYTYTRDGSPAKLQLPEEPGDYDIVYVLDQDRTVVQRVPVTVK